MDLDLLVLMFWSRSESRLPGNCVYRESTEAGDMNQEGPQWSMVSPRSLQSPLLKTSEDRKAPLPGDSMMNFDGENLSLGQE